MSDRNKEGIANSFSKAALNYDNHAKFQRICGNRILNLIGKIKKVRYVLDAGCGTGWFSNMLRNHSNLVIALDLSLSMITYAKKKKSASIYIVGDIEKLPFITNSIDIIFTNLVVQWCNNLSEVLSELYRVLRPGGIIALSTLAKGSLYELEKSWKKVDNNIHINRFLSYTSIATAFDHYRHNLLSETHIIYYPSIIKIFRDIKGVGANYLYYNRKQGLTSRSILNKLEKYWTKHSEGFPLSYNVVYGLIYRD